MITVYKNANFISLNKEGAVFSTLVTNKKKIAYVGYNTPICYENCKEIDLNGAYVVPLINEMIYFNPAKANCTVLAEGENADFLVLDRNIQLEGNAVILEVYKKGKKLKI